MPVGGSEPSVNITGGGSGGCQWVVVNHQSTLLVEVGVGASGW